MGSAWGQLLKLKHDKLLSNSAFNCNLRHCNWPWYEVMERLGAVAYLNGEAVQLDPEFSQLTLRLLSGTFNACD